jgi:hypothetical protein
VRGNVRVCDVSSYVCVRACVRACACVDVCMQVLWSPTTFGPQLTCVTCVSEEEREKTKILSRFYQESIESLSHHHKRGLSRNTGYGAEKSPCTPLHGCPEHKTSPVDAKK